MFEIGWTEILVIAIVLIVVVGPKDLPPMLRAFGKMTSKMRTMAGEFRGQFDEAMREAELDDVKKTLNEARNLNPMSQIKDAMNPLKAAGDDIRSNLEKSVKVDPKPSSPAPAEPPAQPKVEIPTPPVALADGPPVIAAPPKVEPAAPAVRTKTAAKSAAAEVPAAKPAAKVAAKPAEKTSAAKTAAKPAAAKPVAAKPAAVKPAASATAAKPAAPRARKSTKDTA